MHIDFENTKQILKSKEYKAAKDLCALDKEVSGLHKTYCDSAFSFLPEIIIMGLCALLPFGNGVFFLISLALSIAARGGILALGYYDVLKHVIPEAIIGVALFVVYTFTPITIIGSKKILCFVYIGLVLFLEIFFAIANKAKVNSYNRGVKSREKESETFIGILNSIKKDGKDYCWWDVALYNLKDMLRKPEIFIKKETKEYYSGNTTLHSNLSHYKRIKIEPCKNESFMSFIKKHDLGYRFNRDFYDMSDLPEITEFYQILLNEESDDDFRIDEVSRTAPTEDEIDSYTRRVNEKYDDRERYYNGNWHTNAENYWSSIGSDLDVETKNYLEGCMYESEMLRQQEVNDYIRKNTHIEDYKTTSGKTTDIKKSTVLGCIANGEFFLKKDIASLSSKTYPKDISLIVLGMCSNICDGVVLRFAENPIESYSNKADAYVANFIAHYRYKWN